jgi:DNA modification methylase
VSVAIHTGDCLEVMRGMADQSANCCVTSPPYFGLRDYGVDGQIGLEPTPDAYVARLVEVFGEVRRVLRDDGTLWLNLGDSYGGGGDTIIRGRAGEPSSRPTETKAGAIAATIKAAWLGVTRSGLPAKNLIGIPWRVAFALQSDGWYLPQDIIRHKHNPMPESVTDRCTNSHEYVFLMAKSARYWYDAEAVQEQAIKPPGSNGNFGNKDASARCVGVLTGNMAEGVEYRTKEHRNRRSVWTVATRPYAEAHFATFPPDLIRPCILAGCPVGGTVLDPFGGSGTTGMVAEEEGRHSVLIELNPEYVKLARRRTAQMGLLTRSAA